MWHAEFKIVRKLEPNQVLYDPINLTIIFTCDVYN